MYYVNFHANIFLSVAKMSAERQVFSLENTVIITTNEEITARQTRSYLLNNWEKLTSNRKSIRILILAGIHGYEDGKLGPIDQGLQKDNENQIKVLKRKLKEDFEKRDIEIEAIDVGQHQKDQLLDENKLLDTIKDFQPTMMILGICWSRLSELNDLFRAKGIYPELALNQDLVSITKGKNCTLDPSQKGFITQVAEKQPKNVFLWGPPGSGKTLLAAEVVKMKISHYYRQMKLEMSEFNRKVKIIVCAFSSIPLPLLAIDLQDGIFSELRKQFSFSFYQMNELCHDLAIPWLPFEPQKCIENLFEHRLSFGLSFEKIILFIDEVNPGHPADWSTFNPDYEKVDCILSMRYEYSQKEIKIGTTFQILPPSNRKLTLSHQLLKRYRCSKEVQLISLFHEKHCSDAFKLSGNTEDIAEIEKLPSGNFPVWIDREKGILPDQTILEGLLEKFKPVVEENEGDIMVIYNKHKPDMNLLIWLEKQGCRCFDHIQMIGTEAFMVIVLDVENFDTEMVTRARNILLFVTDINEKSHLKYSLHCMLQHSDPDLYCMNLPNCPFHGMQLLGRFTYCSNEKPLETHELMSTRNIFSHLVPKNLALTSNDLETAQKITTQPMENKLALMQEAANLVGNIDLKACFTTEFDAQVFTIIGEKTQQVYTAFYPEENVWHLCHKLREFKDLEAYVVFVSNEQKLVALTGNGLGSTYGALCTNIFDYHTIFLVNSSTKYCTVYDLDCQVIYPMPFEPYCQFSYKDKQGLNAPTFRVIPFLEFLQNFASDRSHMIKEGSFIKPPPKENCIETETTKMNLNDFVSMDPDRGVGTVLSLEEFEQKFKSQMKNTENSASSATEMENLLPLLSKFMGGFQAYLQQNHGDTDDPIGPLIGPLKQLVLGLHETQDEINAKENKQ